MKDKIFLRFQVHKRNKISYFNMCIAPFKINVTCKSNLKYVSIISTLTDNIGNIYFESVDIIKFEEHL